MIEAETGREDNADRLEANGRNSEGRVGPGIRYTLVGRGSRTFATYSQRPWLIWTGCEQCRRRAEPRYARRTFRPSSATRTHNLLFAAMSRLSVAHSGTNGSAHALASLAISRDKRRALRISGERSGASPHQSISDPGFVSPIRPFARSPFR
jgi:hypothetical protein